MSIQFKVLALSFKLQEDKVIRDWADERIEFQTYQYARRLPATIAEETNGS